MALFLTTDYFTAKECFQNLKLNAKLLGNDSCIQNLVIYYQIEEETFELSDATIQREQYIDVTL